MNNHQEAMHGVCAKSVGQYQGDVFYFDVRALGAQLPSTARAAGS